MDEQGGESEEEVMGEGTDESEIVPEWGSRRDKGSYNSRDKVKHNERSDQLFLKLEDDEGGRARVTTDEERVLRGRWTEMRIWRLSSCENSVGERSLYSMLSVTEPVERA